MKVLLADDHVLVRDGISSLLKANGIDVVGEASDGIEALEKARELSPDIILMDIQMPNRSGIEATRLIKNEMPDIKIIMLTVSDNDNDMYRAFKNGAEGYLLKNIKGEEFIATLDNVISGRTPISPAMAFKIVEDFVNRSSGKDGAKKAGSILKERELEILRMVGEGALNKEIAIALNISENTVKYHIRNMLEKLNVRNKAGLASYAVKTGLIANSAES